MKKNCKDVKTTGLWLYTMDVHKNRLPQEYLQFLFPFERVESIDRERYKDVAGGSCLPLPFDCHYCAFVHAKSTLGNRWVQWKRLSLMAIKNIWSAMTRVGPQILISLSFVLALGLLTLNFRHLDTFRRSVVLDCPDFSLKNSDPTSKFTVHREVIFKEKVNSIHSSSTLSKDVQTHIQAEVFQEKVTKNDEDDCPPYQFVMTTDDRGRLGNQMSEYATLIALSTLAGYTPFISKVSPLFFLISHRPSMLYCFWSSSSTLVHLHLIRIHLTQNLAFEKSVCFYTFRDKLFSGCSKSFCQLRTIQNGQYFELDRNKTLLLCKL